MILFVLEVNKNKPFSGKVKALSSCRSISNATELVNLMNVWYYVIFPLDFFWRFWNVPLEYLVLNSGYYQGRVLHKVAYGTYVALFRCSPWCPGLWKDQISTISLLTGHITNHGKRDIFQRFFILHTGRAGWSEWTNATFVECIQQCGILFISRGIN